MWPMARTRTWRCPRILTQCKYTFFVDLRAFLQHVSEESKAFLQLIFLVIHLMVFIPLQIFTAVSWTLKKKHLEHKLHRASVVHQMVTVSHYIDSWNKVEKSSLEPRRQCGYLGKKKNTLNITMGKAANKRATKWKKQRLADAESLQENGKKHSIFAAGSSRPLWCTACLGRRGALHWVLEFEVREAENLRAGVLWGMARQSGGVWVHFRLGLQLPPLSWRVEYSG